MTATAEETAEEYLALAQHNYGEDGFLAPTVVIRGPSASVIVGIAPCDDPAAAALGCVGMLAPVLHAETVVMLNEAWHAEYRAEEAPDLEHGDLGRMHEAGDESVSTALIVAVFNLTDREDSLCLQSIERPDGWQTLDLKGWPEGRVGEVLVEVLAMIAADPPPEGVAIRDVLPFLATWASHVEVMEW